MIKLDIKLPSKMQHWYVFKHCINELSETVEFHLSEWKEREFIAKREIEFNRINRRNEWNGDYEVMLQIYADIRHLCTDRPQ